MATSDTLRMSVDSTDAIPMGDAIYYTSGWRTMIESHLNYLLMDPNHTTLTVTPLDAYRFEGDLLSLLVANGVAPYLTHVIMRMNGMRTPAQYTSTMTTLLVPYQNTINTLRKLYQTVSTKSN